MTRPAFALVLALAACTAHPRPGQASPARRLAEGPGQALLASPAGGAAVYLRNPIHPRGPLLPPDAFLGELTLIDAYGTPHPLGPGATNLAGAVLFSPDGRFVAFLHDFDFSSHQGLLAIADAEGNVHPMGSGVTFFGFSPDGHLLGYIAGGALSLVPLAGAGKPISLGSGVATFEFSSDSRAILFRRGAAGGELVLATVDGRASPIVVARGAADYRFDAKGQAIAYTLETPDRLPELHLWKGGAQRLLGTAATSFEFSPDGRTLAYVAGVRADYLEGDVFVAPVAGGAPRLVGRHAGAYRFSADGRLAFLHDYYDQSRSGRLAVWSPGGEPIEVASSVSLFGWSHQGAYLAWLHAVSRPMYTEQLFLAQAERPSIARFVGEAIYAFDFSPDDRELLFKTRCISGGTACDLMEVPTAAPAAPAAERDGGPSPEKATRVAAGVQDYDFSPDQRWLWLAFMEPVGHIVDLALIPAKGWSLPRYFAHAAEPHPRWLPDGRIAFLVNGPKHAGFYEVRPLDVPAALAR